MADDLFNLAFDVLAPSAKASTVARLIAAFNERFEHVVVIAFEGDTLRATLDRLEPRADDRLVEVGAGERVIGLDPLDPLLRNRLGADELHQTFWRHFHELVPKHPSEQARTLLDGVIRRTLTGQTPRIDALADTLGSIRKVEPPPRRARAGTPAQLAKLAANDFVFRGVERWIESLLARLVQTDLLGLLLPHPNVHPLAHLIERARTTYLVLHSQAREPAERHALTSIVLAHVEAGLRGPDRRPRAVLVLDPTGHDLDMSARTLHRLRSHRAKVSIDCSGVLRCNALSLKLLSAMKSGLADRPALPASHPLVSAGLVAGSRLQAPQLSSSGALHSFAAGKQTACVAPPDPKLGATTLGYGRLRTDTLHRFGIPRARARSVAAEVLARQQARQARAARARIMARAFTAEGLFRGYLKVRSSGGGAGRDGVTLERFAADIDRRLQQLRTDLARGRYRPQPLMRVYMPKSDGGQRPIDVATVRDRIVHAAIARPLSSVVDPTLTPSVYGYRPGIGAHTAITSAHAAWTRGARFAAKVDIEKCFEFVDHQTMWGQLQTMVPHGQTLQVLLAFLQQWHIIDSQSGRPRGIAQGASVSPLLLNLYLTPLDRALGALDVQYHRYADDILILGGAASDTERAVATVERVLRDTLRMRLNRRKTVRACPSEPFSFLGVLFHHGVCRIPSGRMEEFRQAAAAVLEQQRPASERITKLNYLVDGFGAYFREIGRGVEVDLTVLDDWLATLHERFCAREGIPARVISMTFRRLPRVVASPRVRPPSAAPYGGRPALTPEVGEVLPDLPETFDPFELYEEEGAPSAITEDGADKRLFGTLEAVEAQSRMADQLPIRLDAGWLRVTGYGLYLTRHDALIIAKRHGEVCFEVPAVDVRALHLMTPGITLSTHLITYLTRAGKPLLLADQSGRAHGAILPLPGGKGAHERRIQAGFLDQPEARRFARSLIAAKVDNQRRLLLYYCKYLRRSGAQLIATGLAKTAERLKRAARAIGEGIKADSALFAAEARAARRYWAGVKALLKDRHPFIGRHKRGAADLLNMALNYGYAVLRGSVWRAIVAAGLDPAFGVLHRSRHDSTGLVFDLMEEFRAPVVDRVVFSLVRRGAHLATNRRGDLSHRTRNLIITALDKQLSRRVVHRGQRLPLRTLIDRQPRDFGRLLLGEGSYRPYLMRW